MKKWVLPVLSRSSAYVGGEGFHKDPDNLARLKAGNIEGYLAHLDFSDVVKNARTASWVYDNPGIDTDSDGYAGAYRLCALDSVYRDSQWVVTAAETTWYQGDGVHDWRAAQPPPAPVFWLRQDSMA